MRENIALTTDIFFSGSFILDQPIIELGSNNNSNIWKFMELNIGSDNFFRISYLSPTTP